MKKDTYELWFTISYSVVLVYLFIGLCNNNLNTEVYAYVLVPLLINLVICCLVGTNKQAVD